MKKDGYSRIMCQFLCIFRLALSIVFLSLKKKLSFLQSFGLFLGFKCSIFVKFSHLINIQNDIFVVDIGSWFLYA